MTVIEFDPPFTIGRVVDTKTAKLTFKAAEVAPLSFVKFADVCRKALSAQGKDDRYEVTLQRERILAQTTMVTEDGKKIKPLASDLMLFPIPPARRIIDALPLGEGGAGEIINDAPEKDGISAAIHYKLGTPIPLGGGKEIAELEFLASNYGQLETVLAGSSELFQTVDLLASVAKPIEGSIQRLTGAALDRITIGDGVTIMTKILPRFFGLPVE